MFCDNDAKDSGRARRGGCRGLDGGDVGAAETLMQAVVQSGKRHPAVGRSALSARFDYICHGSRVEFGIWVSRTDFISSPAEV